MFRRPDGRMFTRDPRDVDETADTFAWADADELEPWLAAGFVVNRRENRYVVPTTTARAGRPVELLTLDVADLDRLRELDDLLRQDVPGTDGWRWDPQGFREEIASADPELYVVTADYTAIARVWGTRLGFIGVRREQRRRGIASALLAHVFGVLTARGIDEVTTEIAVDNVASRATIELLGARIVGENVELVRKIGGRLAPGSKTLRPGRSANKGSSIDV